MSREQQQRLAKLRSLIAGMEPLYGELCPMHPQKRQTQGAQLFRQTGPFVLAVAQALQDHEDLFQTVPLSSDELFDDHEMLLALEELRSQLGVLLRLCKDTQLEVEGRALAKAKAVIRRVQIEARSPSHFDPFLHLQREVILHSALKYLPRRGASKRRKSGRRLLKTKSR